MVTLPVWEAVWFVVVIAVASLIPGWTHGGPKVTPAAPPSTTPVDAIVEVVEKQNELKLTETGRPTTVRPT